MMKATYKTVRRLVEGQVTFSNAQGNLYGKPIGRESANCYAVFSYNDGWPLMVNIPGLLPIVNTTKYSCTTSRQLSTIRPYNLSIATNQAILKDIVRAIIYTDEAPYDVAVRLLGKEIEQNGNS